MSAYGIVRSDSLVGEIGKDAEDEAAEDLPHSDHDAVQAGHALGRGVGERLGEAEARPVHARPERELHAHVEEVGGEQEHPRRQEQLDGFGQGLGRSVGLLSFLK